MRGATLGAWIAAAFLAAGLAVVEARSARPPSIWIVIGCAGREDVDRMESLVGAAFDAPDGEPVGARSDLRSDTDWPRTTQVFLREFPTWWEIVASRWGVPVPAGRTLGPYVQRGAPILVGGIGWLRCDHAETASAGEVGAEEWIAPSFSGPSCPLGPPRPASGSRVAAR